MWENTIESIDDRIAHILSQGQPPTNAENEITSTAYYEDIPTEDQEFIDVLLDQRLALMGGSDADSQLQ